MADIGNVSSLTDYSAALLNNTKSSAKANSVKSSMNSINENSTEAELLDACKQFEAYLWEQVYKEVDKSVNIFGSTSEGSYGANMMNVFSDTFIQEISSRSVSDGDNSLAMTLYEQLKRNYGIGTVTAEEIDAAEMAENAAEAGAVSEE